MRVIWKMLFSCLALAGLALEAAAQNPLIPPPSVWRGTGDSPPRRGLCRLPAIGSSGYGANGYSEGDGQGGTEDSVDPFSDLTERESGSLLSSLSVAGTGFTLATATDSSAFASFVAPVVSAGLLTSANGEIPYPLDRVYFNYIYYNRFQVERTYLNPAPPPTLATERLAGFNLNRYDVGLEKTFFGGLASFYIRAPFLDATNIDRSLSINEFEGIGNVNAGLKVTLYRDSATDNILSAGITVAAPTARAANFPARVSVTPDWDDPDQPLVINIRYEKVNPTYIQPWVGGQINVDRLFIQGFLGVLAPTSDQVVPALNSNLAIGYELFESRDGWIKSVTPYMGCQVLAPIHDQQRFPERVLPGGPYISPLTGPIAFPTQVFLTEGVNVFLSERTSVYVGVVQPVAGPPVFDVGATAGINYFF